MIHCEVKALPPEFVDKPPTQCAQNGQNGKKFLTLARFAGKMWKKHQKSPSLRRLWGIWNFLRMRHDGPEIAQRADRVGVLPLAALVGNWPKTYLRGVSFFHLWAHCAPRPKKIQYMLMVWHSRGMPEVRLKVPPNQWILHVHQRAQSYRQVTEWLSHSQTWITPPLPIRVLQCWQILTSQKGEFCDLDETFYAICIIDTCSHGVIPGQKCIINCKDKIQKQFQLVRPCSTLFDLVRPCSTLFDLVRPSSALFDVEQSRDRSN